MTGFLLTDRTRSPRWRRTLAIAAGAGIATRRHLRRPAAGRYVPGIAGRRCRRGSTVSTSPPCARMRGHLKEHHVATRPGRAALPFNRYTRSTELRDVPPARAARVHSVRGALRCADAAWACAPEPGCSSPPVWRYVPLAPMEHARARFNRLGPSTLPAPPPQQVEIQTDEAEAGKCFIRNERRRRELHRIGSA